MSQPYRILATLAILCVIGTGAAAAEPQTPPRRNIIFMVPDGMGLTNVTATRIAKGGRDGAPLRFETLPVIGYQRTHSLEDAITDSAAAASAWASGEKYRNGELSCRDHDRDGTCDGTRTHKKTVLEEAMSRGMAAGLVVTSDITHATPAAFGAHVHSRKCGREVFRQYLDLGIEVLLGGGIAKNKPPCRLDHEKRKSLVARAESEGYTLVHTAKELAGAPSTGRLLGLFRDGGLTSMAERTADCVEPTLAEMTRKALRILEKDPEGFFLLVEGSQIDWANHDRDAETLISEILAFDDAVGTVLDWLAAEAGRWGETLVIVVSDHETGGVLLDYNWVETPADRDWEGSRPRETTLSEAGLRIVYGSKLNHPKGKASHTAADTIIWSNARACGRALDNTDLFAAMMEHLNGTLAPRPEAPM